MAPAGRVDRRGLTTVVEGEHRLVGARCLACGTHTFPPQAGCPRCGDRTEDVALPARGTVWSWTVQHRRPKPPYDGPEEFEPYAVGYVDLGPLKVEGRLEGRPVDGWSIGEAVRLVPGSPDASGKEGNGEVWRYRFVPEGALAEDSR